MPAVVASRLADATRQITLGVRPEFMSLGADGAVPGTVKLIEMMGSRTLVLVENAGQDIRVLMQGEPPVHEGDRVGVTPDLARAFYFDADDPNLLVSDRWLFATPRAECWRCCPALSVRQQQQPVKTISVHACRDPR